MRPVAVLIPLMLLLAAVPAARAADDDCAAVGLGCRMIQTGVAPGVPPAAVHTYYVYWITLTCPPTSNSCHSKPPAHQIGVVWEEANGLEGLQRAKTITQSGIINPDTVHLY